MNPEAVRAFVSKTMRPQALEAAKAPPTQENTQPVSTGPSGTGDALPSNVPNTVPTTSALSPPSSDSTGDIDGIYKASTLVSEVIHSAKTAVDDALSWAEKKVGSLGSGKGGTGPYDSPATCAPSDLDAITSSILPAVPKKSYKDKDARMEGNEIQGTKEGKPGDKCKT